MTLFDIVTESSTMLPDPAVNTRHQIEEAVHSVIRPDHGPVTRDRMDVITIPWPTRDDYPISEHTTNHLFTMEFR